MSGINPYRFEKIYADLVTKDGTVLILYLTWMDLAGLTFRQAAATIYERDGSREFRIGSHDHSKDVFGLGFNKAELNISLKSGSITVRYEHAISDDQLRFKIGSNLTYSCLVLKADCTALLQVNGTTREFKGQGYVDDVTIDTPTRRLGLENLQWGRIHCEDTSVLFTRLLSKRYEPIQMLAMSTGYSEEAKVTERFEIEYSEDYSSLLIRSPLLPARELHVENRAILHEGSAIDKRHFPGFFERSLFSLITGSSYERRWLGTCKFGKQPAWVLHEQVAFGRKAQLVRSETEGWMI